MESFYNIYLMNSRNFEGDNCIDSQSMACRLYLIYRHVRRGTEGYGGALLLKVNNYYFYILNIFCTGIF